MSDLAEVHAATEAGDVDRLRRAYGQYAGPFPNVRDECGTTALEYAVAQGPLDLVRQLLALGADPNAESVGGFPALFLALERPISDRYEVMRLLLAAGARVDQRGANDYTALHQAACRDDGRAVELLLAHGADPALRTRIDHYSTALEEAERFGHGRGASALRSRGVVA